MVLDNIQRKSAEISYAHTLKSVDHKVNSLLWGARA